MGDKGKSKCQCEKLQKQLKRYETKFSDLVTSYKTIIEEKNVLEATLKTLSSQSCSSPSSSSSSSAIKATDVSDSSSGHAVGEIQQKSEGIEDGESSSSGDSNQTRLLEEKISVLSKALNSVSEGKTKMEAAFKNDRKSIIADHCIMLQKVEEEKEKAVKREEEIRTKLCQEQQEREDESKAHSLMLKELQEILAVERSEKDVLKLLLHEKELLVGGSNTSQDNVVNNVIHNTDAIQVVVNDNDYDTNEEREDETVEADQVHNLSAEQIQVNQMEDILVDQRAQEERRIVELESKLSELSDVVGNYDRKRQEDQLVIRTLRDRLENLELENSVLTSSQPGTIGLPTKSEKFTGNESVYHNDSTHQSCQEEYKQLLEEFDQYKRKHKDRVSKDSADEIVEYKQRICRLEREIDRLKVYYDEKERTKLKIISGLQIDVTRSKEEYEEKAENISKECKLTVEQMECELRNQRSRTMEVIADRDKEIERLQLKLLEYEGSAKDGLLSSNNKSTDPSTSSKSEDFSVVNEILVNSPSQKGADGLFYFTQQAAHYDSELYTCRMQILDMESQLRDFEKGEEQLLIQMQALKEEIRSLERNKSRESANMEYLKNICLQYMLSDSIGVKTQLSHAISTVLMFSPEEMTQIRKRQKSGWW